MSKRTLLVGFVGLSLMAIAIFLLRIGARSSLDQVTRADPSNRELVARGERLYTTRCASCHGINLEGEPDWPQRRANGAMPASPLDERGQAWRHDDQWLFATIKYGGQATAPPGYTSSMPAMGNGMDDAEIWAVIAYIKRTWPQQIQERQPTVGGARQPP